MSERIQIVTDVAQQSEVYQALKNDPVAVERWEHMMQLFGMRRQDIAKIKKEEK